MILNESALIAHSFSRKAKDKPPILIGDRKGDLIVTGQSFQEKDGRGKLHYRLPVRCGCGKDLSIRIGNFEKEDSSFRCKSCSNATKGDGYQTLTGAKMWGYQRGAAHRGLVWQLTGQLVYELWLAQDRRCSLTGIAVSWADGTASLDRIDSSKGYLPSNIQIVHKDINRMKNAFSQEYFVRMCSLVAGNQR